MSKFEDDPSESGFASEYANNTFSPTNRIAALSISQPDLPKSLKLEMLAKISRNTSWNDFKNILCTDLRAPEDKVEHLKTLFTDKQGLFNETIARQIFDWFPEFLKDDSENAIGFTFKELYEICASMEFWGFLSSAEASRIIENQPAGTYLIRFSSSTGDFAVSCSLGKTFIHWKIKVEYEEDNKKCFSFEQVQSQTRKKAYDSFVQLIEAHEIEPLSNGVCLTDPLYRNPRTDTERVLLENTRQERERKKTDLATMSPSMAQNKSLYDVLPAPASIAPSSSSPSRPPLRASTASPQSSHSEIGAYEAIGSRKRYTIDDFIEELDFPFSTKEDVLKIFRENGITLAALPLLTDEMLHKQLGIQKFGTRLLILEKAKQCDPTTSPDKSSRASQGTAVEYFTPPPPAKKNIPKAQPGELKGQKVFRKEAIGKGAFGEVYKGIWGHAAVALKKLGNTDKHYEEYLIGKDFSHPHVLTTFGAVIFGNDLFLVSEFMDKGDLASYLKKNSTTKQQLINMYITEIQLLFCSNHVLLFFLFSQLWFRSCLY